MASAQTAKSAPSALSKPVLREVLLFAVLGAFGLIVLPIAIFYVGGLVFGDYGGDGFGQFFESILAKLGRGDRLAWFLVLSPYIVIQLLRIAMLAWRLSTRAEH